MTVKVTEAPVLEPAPVTPTPPPRRRITVSSPELYRRQLTHFWVANVAPAGLSLACAPFAWLFGVSPLELVLLVVLYFATTAGIELGFHRGFAHGAFKTGPIARRVFAVLGAMAGQGPTGYWIANHRRHHAYTDREGDPHSPIFGVLHAHVLWMLDREVTLTPRFAADILADKAIQSVDRNYYKWFLGGLLVPGFICGLASLSAVDALGGVLFAGGLRIFLVQQTTFLVNSLCHIHGARRFATGESSRNVGWLSLATLGGSLHHNHHAFPGAARTDLARGEFDPGGFVLRVLERWGWIGDLGQPTTEALRDKLAPDAPEPRWTSSTSDLQGTSS